MQAAAVSTANPAAVAVAAAAAAVRLRPRRMVRWSLSLLL